MLRRWLRDERGSNTVEMVMIVGALLLLTTGVVDVGRLMTEYNAIQKAVEMGAREAVTRAPIVTPLRFHFACNTPSDSNLVGELCIAPDGTKRPECESGDFVCTSAGCTGSIGDDSYTLNYNEKCNSLVPGGPKLNCLSQSVFDGILAEMQSAVPDLSADNVTVSYTSSKLGFVGMAGALPMDVTVDVTDVPFGFLASLPFGEIAWTIPRMSHTFTGEDLSDNTCAEQGLKSGTVGGVPGCTKGGSGSVEKVTVVCLKDP